MENGESSTIPNLTRTIHHPLELPDDQEESLIMDEGPLHPKPNKIREERQGLPRIRLLSLHLISHLFEVDQDYVFMMGFLRELLDWAETIEELKCIRLPSNSCSLEQCSEPQPRNCSVTSAVEPGTLDAIINQCLESEISDFEMASKIENIAEYEIINEDEITPGSFSEKKPLYIWHSTFNPAEYNIEGFIKPLQTGNFGVIIKHMITYGIANNKYDARVRTFILACAQVLDIDYNMFQAYELSAVDEVRSVRKYKKKKEGMSAGSIAAVGLAATGGAVLMTLTGGLAAPFVVSGLATIVGTSGTAFLATTTGLAAIAATFGAVGGGLAGYKVSKLVGSIDEFEFVKVKQEPSVALTIVVDGLVPSADRIAQRNWAVVDYTNEQYLLKYETKYLVQFTNALSNFVKDVAVSVAADELVKYTIFSALAASLAWPVTLLSLSSVIDNPWSVCMKRSKAVGIHLSSVLTKKLHGDRPVTLIGYGLGARVIFFCLLDMVNKKRLDEYSGILENVILCGAPVTSQHLVWDKLCRAVSGKLVNGYSTNDWVLSFLYKTTSATRNIAGVMSVGAGNRKVVNVDVSSVISGHADYATKMGDVLGMMGMGGSGRTVVVGSS